MNSSYERAINKKLALVLWAKDDAGEDDVVVYSGILVRKATGFYFERKWDDESSEIFQEWLPRIRPVPESIKETLLNCDYQLSLSVSDAGECACELEKFGLTWPE